MKEGGGACRSSGEGEKRGVLLSIIRRGREGRGPVGGNTLVSPRGSRKEEKKVASSFLLKGGKNRLPTPRGEKEKVTIGLSCCHGQEGGGS